MPVEGIDKKRLNFVDERVRTQKEFWPDEVRKWDEEAQGRRFRSEVLSMTELWNLYVGGAPEDLTEEEEARGKKKAKKKGFDVIPIKAFELPGRFSEKGKHHAGKFGYLHFNQWLYARDQARKDLFWFGREVFNLDFEPHVHQVTCNQFVQKDFDGVFKEGYTANDFKVALKRQHRVPRIWMQFLDVEKNWIERPGDKGAGLFVHDPIESEKKENYARTMILLDPRGFFKSFTNQIDCVQWIINCPDIRILIMSGTYKLTLQFLTGVKNRFYLPRGLRPTNFHLLFPEYVIRGIDGDSKEPLILSEQLRRLDSLDPTLGIMSIGSSLSGFHCDVLKFDDIVTDENCNTPETREGLQLKADGAVNLLMPWGWHDIIGTRYFPDDYYGEALKSYTENPEDFNLKFFQRAAWKVKDEYRDIEKRSLFDLTADMVTLTFPEHKSFESLRKDLRKNERSFRCQQLNQPVWGDENAVSFPRELLEAHRTKSLVEVMMRPGEVIGAIDLARENKQFSDYTALAIGKIYREGTFFQPDAEGNPFMEQQEGKILLVVMDVQFGKWSQTEIASRIAALNDKWRPKRWIGEDTGGLQLLKEKIIDTSKTLYGHWPYIRWEVPDNSESAKRNRIKGIEILLRANTMWFVNTNFNEVFEQLERYTGQKSTRYFKDDVPDAISLLTKALPSLIPLSKRELEQQAIQKEAEYREYLRRAIRSQVFGDDSGGFGVSQNYMPSPYYNPPEDEPKGPIGNIGNRFFGGNGMRA